jgi:hypothetical protein
METSVPPWLLDASALLGKCVDSDGKVVVGEAAIYGIVEDCGISIWPRYKINYSGEHLVMLMEPAPEATELDQEPVEPDVAVLVGDFLVNVDGRLKVATAESLRMAVVARARESYSGPCKLVLASIWL